MPPTAPDIRTPSTRNWWLALLALAIAAFVIRSPYFGNPLIDDDEQFYLLVGDRLLHGALPYVDIWDRKPLGLFVMFAGIRLLGGDGVLAYQLVAAACVAGTAMLIALIARRIAGPGAAIVAGLAYIPALGLLGGQGGQTPVFYNLPMAAAAWLIVRRTILPSRLREGSGVGASAASPFSVASPPQTPPARGRGLQDAHPSLRWPGALAMLLVGLAIQIKYNALFEGLYFGLALLWLARREGERFAALATNAALWIAAALLPTALTFVAYAAIGHASEFVYANFGSIFSREGIGRAEELHNLLHDLGRIAPFLVALMFAGVSSRIDSQQNPPPPGGGGAEGVGGGGRRRVQGRGLTAALPLRQAAPATSPSRGRIWEVRHFLRGWLIAAGAGFLIFGTYFNHYTLPLLPPLAIAAAPAFAIRRWRLGAALSALMLLAMAISYPIAVRREAMKRGTAAYGYRMAARIFPLLGPGRCLFIFYGAPVYYHLTHSCLPTRWAFPYHLSLRREAQAMGVDPHAEMARILATRPAAILDKVTTDPEVNLAVQQQLRDDLARNYTLVYAHTFPGGLGETDRLWARLPGR